MALRGSGIMKNVTSSILIKIPSLASETHIETESTAILLNNIYRLLLQPIFSNMFHKQVAGLLGRVIELKIPDSFKLPPFSRFQDKTICDAVTLDSLMDFKALDNLADSEDVVS